MRQRLSRLWGDRNAAHGVLLIIGLITWGAALWQAGHSEWRSAVGTALSGTVCVYAAIRL